MAYFIRNQSGPTSGTITTQNLVPAGTATANSAVEITLNGAAGLAIQVTGTYTGALSLQVTLNGTAWITVGGLPLINLNTGGNLASITSALQSVFNADVTGFLKARITALAAVTGTATVTLQAVATTPMVSLDAAIPTGANTIGAVTGSGNFATTMAAAATSPAKAEDAAHVPNDVGMAMLVLRNGNPTSNTSADGDYILPVADIFGSLIVKDQQRAFRTYRTAFVVAPVASATDIFQLIGSATTTVQITKIIISGTQTTGGSVDVFIAKRSTANTGGTSSSSTMVPVFSGDAAPTAVGTIYTANPTPGTPVGDIWVGAVPVPATTNNTNAIVEINFGERGRFPLLSGVAQAMAIRLNGVTVTGGSFKITVEFIEF
jgi:hypothetical protein